MLSEKAIKQASKPQNRPRCHICSSPEGYGADGKQHRLLNAGDGIYECNYCSSQQVDETIRGSGNRYRGFEVTARDTNGTPTEGFDAYFEREKTLIGIIETDPERSIM